MIYEGQSFMRIIIITLVTVNLAAFALIRVGCQRSLEDGGSAKHTCSHCKTSIQCPRGHFKTRTTAPQWKGDRKSLLHCKDPKSNPRCAAELLCDSYSVNEIPLAQLSKCHCFRNRSTTPWRWRGLWELCCQDLCLTHI